MVEHSENGPRSSRNSEKLLLVVDTLEMGGTEQSLLAISSRLRDIRSVICHPYRGTALAPSFEAAGVNVVSGGLSGKYQLVAGVKWLLGVIDRERPDIVHSTLLRSSIIARIVGAIQHVPVVDSFVNDSYGAERWLIERTLVRRLKLSALLVLDLVTSKLATTFTAVSETVKTSNCVALGIDPSKVRVIRRGRDPVVFKATERRKVDELRRLLGVGDGPTVLNVARLRERKGHLELLESFRIVKRCYPTATLLLAGDGPERAAIVEKATDLGVGESVKLLGTSGEIPALLALADVFAFPSHFEGHPGALIEAMMAGTPIVASDTPVHRESVTHGETARLVPLRHPAALAREILWVLDHPEESRMMGEWARRVALERFDVDRMVSEHEELYREVLESWRATH